MNTFSVVILLCSVFNIYWFSLKARAGLQLSKGEHIVGIASMYAIISNLYRSLFNG